MEHCFYFETKDYEFDPAAFLESYVFENSVYMNFYTIEDLGAKFTFCYDTGDGWDFDCRVYKKSVFLNTSDVVIILEGAGQGIWEDNIGTLYTYLSGEISPSFNGEDEERDIYKPWNIEIDKYSDFDAPLDIEKENDDLREAVKFTIEEYTQNETALINENKMNMSDYKAKHKRSFC